MADEPPGSPPAATDKHAFLLSSYRMAFEEMTWRRNAGYRTIIIGFGYFGLIIALVAFNRGMPTAVKACMSAVLILGALFGSAYLASNYGKYMEALRRMVAIEDYFGAFKPDFLGTLGALMPTARRTLPDVPLRASGIAVVSIIAFLIGGVVTGIAVLLM
jgi:hypothetical protein